MKISNMDETREPLSGGPTIHSQVANETLWERQQYRTRCVFFRGGPVTSLRPSYTRDWVIQVRVKRFKRIIDNETVSPSVLWEGPKCVLRGNIIAISSRLKRQRLAEQLGLENKIRQLEN